MYKTNTEYSLQAKKTSGSEKVATEADLLRNQASCGLLWSRSPVSESLTETNASNFPPAPRSQLERVPTVLVVVLARAPSWAPEKPVDKKILNINLSASVDW
jgi:hypothetical protein